MSTTGLSAPNVEQAALKSAIEAPRIRIERIAPCVDGGQFPAKGIVGQTIVVEADIFMDGHGLLAARLIWRGPGTLEEQSTAMLPLGNDRWRSEFTPTRAGRHRFNIEAWRDDWGSYRNDLANKSAAGLPALLDIEEGQRHLLEAVARVGKVPGEAAAQFARRLAGLDELAAAQLLLSEEAASLMARLQQRRFVTHLPADLMVEVERVAAGFASWYEVFPRSLAPRSGEHGTFDDVIARLPALRAMGFDVLYLPPIHPIGRSHRKGRNNSLQENSDDPGSPYALGPPERGHTARHPRLWCVYSGFELCEAAPLPGREEYLDSEKYQIKQRDWQSPGNIIAEISRLNHIRRDNPALQTHQSLRFYNAGNDQVLWYGKSTPGLGNFILVAVSLDPHNVQETQFEVPLWEFGLPDHGVLQVQELMRGTQFNWYGKIQHWRFVPQELPFAIFHVQPWRGPA